MAFLGQAGRFAVFKGTKEDSIELPEVTAANWSWFFELRRFLDGMVLDYANVKRYIFLKNVVLAFLFCFLVYKLFTK
jgi:hypothetical protein